MLKHKHVVFGRVSKNLKAFYVRLANERGSIGKLLLEFALKNGYKPTKDD